ncbi:MAG: TolC family protein [Elusimicrobiales bacterium]
MNKITAFFIIYAAAGPVFAQTAPEIPVSSAPVLSWNEAVELFRANSHQLKSSYSDVVSALAAYNGSYSAFLPNLSASGGYNRYNSTVSSLLNAYNSFDYQLTAAVPLFAGGSNVAGMRKARAQFGQAQARNRQAQADAFRELGSAYAQLLYAQNGIELADEIIARREENLKLIRLRYAAGRESSVSVLESEALLSGLRWERESAVYQWRLAQRALNAATGRRLSEEVRAGALPDIPAPPENIDGLAAELDSHPALESQSRAVKALEENLVQAKSSLYPSGNLSGSFARSDTIFPPLDNTWSLGINFNWDIYSGGKTREGMRSAQAQIDGAKESYLKLKDDVFVAVENAWFNWRESLAHIAALDDNFKAVRARLWLLRKQYAAGTASFFELRDAEERLTSAQKQQLAAARDLFIAYAGFEKAMGRPQ